MLRHHVKIYNIPLSRHFSKACTGYFFVKIKKWVSIYILSTKTPSKCHPLKKKTGSFLEKRDTDWIKNHTSSYFSYLIESSNILIFFSLLLHCKNQWKAIDHLINRVDFFSRRIIFREHEVCPKKNRFNGTQQSVYFFWIAVLDRNVKVVFV